jgi:hypothetical protein
LSGKGGGGGKMFLRNFGNSPFRHGADN